MVACRGLTQLSYKEGKKNTIVYLRNMKSASLFEVMFVIGNKCVVTFTCRMR